MKSIIVAFLGCLVVGCHVSRIDYRPPVDPLPVENSVVVDAPFDVLWPATVTLLSRQFFVINNLDGASGLINISFSANPIDYCDCGIYSITDKVSGEEQSKYPGASGYEVLTYWSDSGRKMRRERTVGLNARANIVLEPMGSSTRATVTCRYAVDEIVHGGTVNGRYPFDLTSSAAFQTNGSGRTKYGMLCWPTGKFERDILDLIRHAAQAKPAS